MKITFIENHQSVLSGHSFYKSGTQADLRRGQRLIDLGIAVEGWTRTLQGKASPTKLDSLSDDELKRLAKNNGIRGYQRMKRETLITRLSE